MGTFKLERWKFGVYFFAPIFAVAVYSIPAVHETSLKLSRYVVHVPSDVPAPRRPAAERLAAGAPNSSASPPAP
jgi:hypothetical protein